MQATLQISDPKLNNLSFIVNFHWGNPKHHKEAIKIWLAAQGLSGLDQSTKLTNCGLSEEESLKIKELIASNPNTPVAVLCHLSRSGIGSVLEKLAVNPNTPGSVLTTLALNADTKVRSAVAENPNAPAAALYRLAHDQEDDVRYQIAENPNMPIDIIDLLSKDENPYVRQRACQTLDQLCHGKLVQAQFKALIGRITKFRQCAEG